MSTESRKSRPHPATKAGTRIGFATHLAGDADFRIAPAGMKEILEKIWKKPAQGRRLKRAIQRAEETGQPQTVTLVIDPLIDDATDDVVLERAIAAAKSRGDALVAEILRGQDMLSADEFAGLLGVSRETVNQKRRKHEVLALDRAKRGYRFPRWQVDADGRLLPCMGDLFEALGGNAWTVYRFLLQPHAELDGRRGVDAIQEGRIEPALAVAKSIGTGSFS